MSKGYIALVAALAFLAGAGCTAAAMLAADKLQPDTAVETQEDTAAQKESFYDFIKNDLIPEYGISDMALFDKYGYLTRSFLEQPIPEYTQGIIGAQLYDFDQDGTEEGIVIRAEESAYFLDLFTAEGEHLDEYCVWSFTPNECFRTYFFTLSIIDHRLVIEGWDFGMPGFSSYGTNAVILEVSEDGFTEQLCYGGNRSPGACRLYVNDDSIFGGEPADGTDVDAMLTLLEKELALIGMEWNELHSEWDVGRDLSYGLKVDYADEPIYLFDFGDAKQMFYFMDYTNLRNRLP